MRLQRFALAAAVSAAATFAGPIVSAGAQSVAACPGADTALSGSSLASAKAAMVCLLNNERLSRGLPALSENSALDQAAQAHADDMVARNYEDVTAPDPAPQGTSPRDRATFFGYGPGNVYGIWLGQGSTPRSNATIVAQQAGLCATAIDPAYTDLGVGVALASDGPRFSISYGGQGTPMASNPSCPARALATPAASGKAAAQALAKQPPSVIAGQLGFPAAKTCQSRRAFYIRVREPNGIKLRSATLYLAGKKSVAKRSNGRLRALVDLRGFAKGSFKLKIVVRTTTGVTLSGYRTYKTCQSAKL